MTVLTDSWLLDILALLTALVTIFIAWVRWSQTYWSRKGLYSPTPTFFFGSCMNIFMQKQSFGEFAEQLYKHFKSKSKPHGGFYFMYMPTYMPVNPDVIKCIIQNDFEHFVNRGVYYNEEVDPLSAHLVSLEGNKWKNLRVKLTPTFTSGKMKMMFDTLVKCGDQLIVEMDKNVGKDPVDINNVLERFTTDIFGNCAFGLDCNSLKNPDELFTKNLKLFFVKGFWDNIALIISFVAPGVARKFSMKTVNPTLTNFFMRVIKDTVSYRETNDIYRKDFMHLLLQLKNRGQLSDDGSILESKADEKQMKITMNELAAQAFVFFLAGFETSSTVMTFCLFELASNPEIQEKLRQEVCGVLAKHNDKLTYDAIMEMNYMEKVINETLRKYPAFPTLNRICTKDYKVPGTDMIIEKDTKVLISLLGLHRDPDFYPDPEKFDPERFSEDNKRQRHPYTFLPFGEGPRICIGLRFGVMQTKVGLSILLRKYRFSISSKTILPLELNPKNFVMSTKGGMWLDYTEV